MTTDHMRVYSPSEVDEILARHLAAAKEGVLIGLLMAAISGAASMLVILWIIGKVFP